MKIGLYYAMPGEVASLVESGAQLFEESCGVRFYRVPSENHDVIAAVGGVGKVNAAMSTQMMISGFSPDLILNIGVAGCFKNVSIGTILLARSFVQHDVDTTAAGDPPGMVSTVNLVEFETDAFEIVERALDRLGIEYLAGRGATGDWFATATPRAERIREMFDPLFCEMEGGAVAQVCLRNRVPFMAIKTVSDCLFGDDNYLFNYPVAMERLNGIVLGMIRILENVHGAHCEF